MSRQTSPGTTTAARSAAAAARESGPRLITDQEALRHAVRAAQQAGQTVGLVPTMGALHDGHLSLVDAARAECDVVVVTIYVNPTQFAPGEDFERYPRDLEADKSQLEARGCDLIFVPGNEAMYGADHSTWVDVGPLADVLEGEFRPGHFRGVATIVLKLLQLAPADRAYFGRKDYQQTLVVQKMVEDLNVATEICVCPTVREPDGLAMSSRNAFLTKEERARAGALSQSLQLAERLVAGGERDVDLLRQRMQRQIDLAGGVEVQYIAFVADGTVTPVNVVNKPTVVALAAKVGSTRLIDNTLLEPGA
jgi:pantoate--beta-alanine ligase